MGSNIEIPIFTVYPCRVFEGKKPEKQEKKKREFNSEIVAVCLCIKKKKETKRKGTEKARTHVHTRCDKIETEMRRCWLILRFEWIAHRPGLFQRTFLCLHMLFRR